MERLTNKREADAQRKDYENRIKNGYPRNIPEERFLRLAAYEDTKMPPELVEKVANEVDDDGRKIVLCHYPIPCFKNHFYGWYHLYGHVHKSFEHEMMEHDKYLMQELYGKQCQMFNVGAMMPYMDYTPRTIDEILKGAS